MYDLWEDCGKECSGKQTMGLKLLTKYIAISLISLSVSFNIGSSQAKGPPFLAERHHNRNVSCIDCHGIGSQKEYGVSNHCLSCHPLEKLVLRTEELEANPHRSHQGSLPCNECHKGHKPSVLYCERCHQFKMRTP